MEKGACIIAGQKWFNITAGIKMHYHSRGKGAVSQRVRGTNISVGKMGLISQQGQGDKYHSKEREANITAGKRRPISQHGRETTITAGIRATITAGGRGHYHSREKGILSQQ